LESPIKIHSALRAPAFKVADDKTPARASNKRNYIARCVNTNIVMVIVISGVVVLGVNRLLELTRHLRGF